MKKYLLGIIPVIILALVLVPNLTMQAIVSGNNVTLDYTGYLSDGSVFDSSINKTPLTFTVGAETMIPGFESAVLGMKAGESKTFTLEPSEAYGNYLSDLIFNYNKTLLAESISVEPEVGMTLYTSTGFPAQITAVNEENVTIDLNHPLAGKSLTFSIKILEVK